MTPKRNYQDLVINKSTLKKVISMKKFIVVLMVAMAVSVFAFSSVALSCSACGCSAAKDAAASEGEVINKTCPVMGGEVSADTPYKTVHKGKTIGFCCEGCIDAFEKDPDKYLDKLNEELEEKL